LSFAIGFFAAFFIFFSLVVIIYYKATANFFTVAIN